MNVLTDGTVRPAFNSHRSWHGAPGPNVSAGGFGGTRVLQSLLLILRELGLISTLWDGNFSKVSDLFDENSQINDPAYPGRIDEFPKDLMWVGVATIRPE